MLNRYDSHRTFPTFHKTPQVTYLTAPYHQHLPIEQLQFTKFRFNPLSLIRNHLRVFHYLKDSSVNHHLAVMFDTHFLIGFVFQTHCIGFLNQSHLKQLIRYRLNQFQWSSEDRFTNLHIVLQPVLKFTFQDFWLHWCISSTYFWFLNFASCFNHQDQSNELSDLKLVLCLYSNVWFLSIQFLFQRF